MKKLFYLILFLLAEKSFAQDCIDTRHVPSAGGSIQINPAGIDYIGQQEIDAYRNLKNPPDPSGKKKNIDYISYDPCGFLALLNLLSSNPNYTGLRIYIASDASKNLTLIFSPTEQDWDDGNEVDEDVSYWEINGKELNQLTINEASAAVKSFQDNQMKAFNDDGIEYYKDNPRRRQSKDFNETTQLWYDISQFNSPILKYGDYLEAGMRIFLQYLINGNAVDSVILNFAAFIPTEPPVKYDYQLNLVFDFYKKNPPESNAFLSGETNHAFLITPQYHSAAQSGSQTNTGVPCPPPPTGQQCPGSLPK